MKTDFAGSYAVLSICLGYAVAAWLVQMHRVAAPRDWLLQRIWFLKALPSSDPWHDDLDKVASWINKPWLFLSVSKVQSGWRNIHGVEDARLLTLTGERLEEQLRTAQGRLTTIPGPETKALVKRLSATPKDEPDAQKAALLREAEVHRHNYNDTNYENLASLLGKAVWLSWVALGAVVLLAVLYDRESYFLLGAAGGLISRLTRVLQRRPRAKEYGAEWSTLILSPAAGALVGWAGVAITAALANDPFNILGDQFGKPWNNAAGPLGLTVAFLFGFSERLFNRLLGVAEAQLGAKLPKEERAAAGAGS